MEKTLNTSQTPSSAPRYWGFWTSLGWAILGYALIVLAQLGAVIIQTVPSPFWHGTSDTQSIAEGGWTLGLSFPVALLLVILFSYCVVRSRKGSTLETYLGLRRVPFTTFLPWIGLTVLFEILAAAADLWFGRPRTPEFLVKAYETPGSLPLLWFSIVFAGPVAEELLFRGLVLPGWSTSRLGPWGAVGLISLLFASVHLQYDLYNMGLVFIIGVMLGAARLQTESIYPSIAMHMLINGVGMGVVAFDHSG